MIHPPHPAIAHLPVSTMLFIFLHNVFSLPATTHPEGLCYCSKLFTHYKFVNRSHTSYVLAYEDGTDRMFRNVDTSPFPIQFFCHLHTPQLLFILGGKEVGGLLVIILQF
jgi:hypothetical protein